MEIGEIALVVLMAELFLVIVGQFCSVNAEKKTRGLLWELEKETAWNVAKLLTEYRFRQMVQEELIKAGVCPDKDADRKNVVGKEDNGKDSAAGGA